MKEVDDIYTNNLRKYRNDYYNRKMSEKLINFISCKNKIKFKTIFDRKGAKQFLNEKEKAMEKMILDDTTDDDNNNKNSSNDDIKKDIPEDKYLNRNKILEHHQSHDPLLNNIKINNKHMNKKPTEMDKYMSSNTIFLINSIKDIGKIEFNNSKKKVFIGSIKKKYADKKDDSSYLMTSDNDSFIDSIIHQMDEIKN
jgi:hypothetical protein